MVIPIHDFDQVIYRIRPIDFDQQTYEGNLKVYLPQYFKENNQMVTMVMEKLKPSSIEQYRKEVRSQIVKRVTSSKTRFDELISIMKKDNIAPEANVSELKTALQKLTYDVNFKYCKSMGDIIETGIRFVVRNYKKEY